MASAGEHGQGSNAADIEARINALLAQMTLEEKLGQLQQGDADFYTGMYKPHQLEMARKGQLGSILNVRSAKNTNDVQRAALESRLKIPILLGYDVLHGYRTLFPVPLGEAASWDLAGVERAASIAAAEARSAGVHWTFAPMVDLARDPRWGRVVEGAGEDVYLASEMAKARVHGFQGTDFSRGDKIMACAKHFAGYGAGEAGLDYNGVDMSEHRLRELYLPPFKAAIDAGVGSIMTAYIDLNGVPASANKWLMQTVLRDEWKFNGLVVSDYNAITELVMHGYAANHHEAAFHGLNTGTDLEMTSTAYAKNGVALVESGQVKMEKIDRSVRNVLRAKFQLGLFDNPFANESLEASTLRKPEFLQAARESSAQSFVLLKNANQTLPIDTKRVKSIAVIGGLADDQVNMLDIWSAEGKAAECVTVLQGLREALAGTDTKVVYEPGCDAKCLSATDFPKAVAVAKQADFSVVVVGETGHGSGEAGSVSDIGLPGLQVDLIKAVHAAGKPYVVVLTNGRPLAIPWPAENSPAILETWKSGTMAGAAVADVLLGHVNPSGKLPMTFPRSTGQIPVFYDHKMTGRPYDPARSDFRFHAKYLDCPHGPLYVFGFGLSYTTFLIDNLTLSAATMPVNGAVTVAVDVENTGGRDGAEVVQLYIRDVAASVTRPVRQLKAFQKVHLKVGEKRRLQFALASKDLAFLGHDMKMVVEPGLMQVFVGNSSETSLMASFTIV